MLSHSPIKEDFLHFLWRTKKIGSQNFETTDGRWVEIIDFGIYNSDAGPDFFNGKIELDHTIWAGNIEMHIFSSDWKRHKHQVDKAYENVILHVVYEHDSEIFRADGSIIPVIELKGKIPKHFLDTYLSLIQSSDDIPCKNLISAVSPQKIDLWKYTLAIERIEQKTTHVSTILASCNDDWEECFYILLARYFGSKVNTEAFESLARKLPLFILRKNQDKPLALDALYFGQAGFLNADFDDAYFQDLKKEYYYQQKKYQLVPMNPVAWKFSKLRPMNFPSIRIAQFSALMSKADFLFSSILEIKDPAILRALFKTQLSFYWKSHYRFGHVSKPISKNMGPKFIDLLLINAVVPILFEYGKRNDDQTYIDQAIAILESIPSEKNAIIDNWKVLHVSSKSAFDSQALIQLKTQYCDAHRCLSCQIGNEIISGKS